VHSEETEARRSERLRKGERRAVTIECEGHRAAEEEMVRGAALGQT
jgi:hypothetical protein